MKIFNTDIQELGRLLSPTMFRTDIIALVQAVLAPLNILLGRLRFFRKQNLYGLGITGQVFALEKMLNDRYDIARRRIHISDGEIRVANQYIFTEQEQNDQHIFSSAENEVTYYNTSAETGYIGTAFIVNIPEVLDVNEDEVRVMVNKYKLVGKTFNISRYVA